MAHAAEASGGSLVMADETEQWEIGLAGATSCPLIACQETFHQNWEGEIIQSLSNLLWFSLVLRGARRNVLTSYFTPHASGIPIGGYQAAPSNAANGGAIPTTASFLAALEAAATCEDPYKVKETYARLDEQAEVAKAMPVAELSEVLKAKAQMAVDGNWTVDAPVKVLSQQGLEAAYRAFLETLAVPRQMEAEEFHERMHRFGLTLLYVIRQQEAFGFQHACCNEEMDQSLEERKWAFGTLEEV